MRRYATMTLLALATAPVAAQMELPKEAPGTPNVRNVVAGTYKIDPAHSQVLFTVSHLGFTNYTGQFTNPHGSLTIDPAHPDAAKLDVAFPIADVRTTVAELDKEMNGPMFFDSAKYPEGRFVSTKVVARGMAATITGNLTLHGITKPVVLHARLVGAGKAFWGEKKTNIGFTATTSIRRGDFGMGFGGAMVSDKVDLVINAGFEAE